MAGIFGILFIIFILVSILYSLSIPFQIGSMILGGRKGRWENENGVLSGEEPVETGRKISNTDWQRLVFSLFCLLFVVFFVYPHFMRMRASGQYTQCQSNEKNLGTALEMYAKDNEGHYPERLAQLTPQYLQVMPTCGATGIDTYSHSYTAYISPDAHSDAFTFYCEGDHYKYQSKRYQWRVPENYPQYNSRQGLISR